jgi:UDP-N-acetylmuramoyl-tripeptide--D-alanyl-D-alanine ligase
MRQFFVNILSGTLRTLARLTIRRYQPGVVGVTGSVGKTSTKLAIAAVLASVRRVRASAGNLNNNLGLPLAILGDWPARDLALVSRETPPGAKRLQKFFFWCRVIFQSLGRLIAKDEHYPEILVLEYGADRPGNIRSLLRIVRPNVSAITAIGDVPVHLEFYSGPEAVAREKGRLIESLSAAGFAVLNYDDEAVMRLEPRTRGRVISYGLERGADVRVTRFENWVDGHDPRGVSFRLEFSGGSVPVRLAGAFGKGQAYAAAAAAAAGLIFGMNLVKISEALQGYRPAPARMQLLPGIKYTYIIDDSYNASPLSMQSALETFRDLPAKRRIAVLGDMLEIGKYAPEAHEEIGRVAAGIADLLFTVGLRAKFIAEAARKRGMKAANIQSFDAADEAGMPLQEAMREGDLVLVKGSHAMELNKVVEEVKFIAPSSSSPV